jgi:hypothetical protein
METFFASYFSSHLNLSGTGIYRGVEEQGTHRIVWFVQLFFVISSTTGK